MPADLSHLRDLLQRRLDLIADPALRDRDAPSHPPALQKVSEDLTADHQKPVPSTHTTLPTNNDG